MLYVTLGGTIEPVDRLETTVDENIISAVPLFSALDEEDQRQLAAMMTEVVFRRGGKLFNE